MATTTEFVKSREVRELTFTLTYSDTTATKVATLPTGARIIAFIANVKTALSGGTTTFNVGTTTTATELVSGESGAATGNIDLGTHLADPGHETTVPTDIYAYVGGSNTAGEIDVTILFSLAKGTKLN